MLYIIEQFVEFSRVPWTKERAFSLGEKAAYVEGYCISGVNIAKEIERKRFRIQSTVHTVVQAGAASRRKAGEQEIP